jgi:hypothetical protein
VQWKSTSERLLQEIDAKIAHVGSETQRAKAVQAQREQDQKTARDAVFSAGFDDRPRGSPSMMGFPSDCVFEQIEPEVAHPAASGPRERRLPTRSIRSRHES